MLSKRRRSFSPIFGEFVRHYRKTMFSHMTLNEFAEDRGISGPYLSQIENGKVPPPSLEKVDRLADALEIDRGLLRKMAGYHKDNSSDFDASARHKEVITMDPAFVSADKDVMVHYVDPATNWPDNKASVVDRLRYFGRALLLMADAAENGFMEDFNENLLSGNMLTSFILYSRTHSMVRIRSEAMNFALRKKKSFLKMGERVNDDN